MKRLAITATLLVAAGLTAPALAQDPLGPLQGKTERLAREVGASVVGFGSRRMNRGASPADVLDAQAGGCGFIIDEAGHILTSASLAPDGSKFEVTLRGHHRASAKFVARDPRTHVALLKLEDPEGVARALGGKIPHVKLGRADGLKRGRLVATVGNPFGSVQTDGVPAFSVGIVSAIGRLRDADRYKGRVIETDAAINPGSFGGPLVDLEGRVVGVVIEAISPKRWLGVAIPIDEIAAVLQDLKAGKQPGPPRLGISIKARAESRPGGGLSISEVDTNGPAARAGVRVGDQLVAFDGSPVVETFDLERELAHLCQGAPVELALEREGRKLSVRVVLGAGEPVLAVAETVETPVRPLVPALTPQEGKPWLGLNVEEREDGLYLKQVAPDGPAAKAKLKDGDKLVQFAGKAVKSRKDVIDAVAATSPGQKVELRIEREGWAKTVEVVIGSKEGTAAKPEGPKPEGPKPGKRQRPAFLGLAVEDAEGDEGGLPVVTVHPGSPADKAKIKAGDVLVAIGGTKMTDREKFVQTVRSFKPGETVKIKLKREGWDREVEVTLAERPAELDPPEQRDPEEQPKTEAPRPWLGMAIAERDGRLVVDELADGAPAEKAGLKKGDAIVEAQTTDEKWHAVKTLDDLEKVLSNRKPGEVLVLRVDRDGWTKPVKVTLGEKK